MRPSFMASDAIAHGRFNLRVPSSGEAVIERAHQTLTMSGAVTLTIGGAQATRMAADIIYVDCNGADRDLTLPAPSLWHGERTIVNISSGAYTVTVKNSAASTIAQIDKGEGGKVFSDGTTTRALGYVANATSGDDFGVDGIKADQVNESTSGEGVLLDASSVLVKDGTVQAGAGTAAAPSLSFLADKNTGWFNLAADDMALALGGVIALGISGGGAPTVAAATDTAGVDYYERAPSAGATPTTAKAGAAYDVGAGAGASAANAVACGAGGASYLRGGAGGANTGAASGQVGGAGGASSVLGGAGGATNSTGAHASGAGGAATVQAGAAGASSGLTSTAAGNGGDASLISGAGGTKSTAGTGAGGNGGALAVTSGRGGAQTAAAAGGAGGNAGTITVTGGVGGETNSSAAGAGGIGGGLTVTLGAGGESSGGTGAGGAGGAYSATAGNGGAQSFVGASAAGGAGGLVSFTAGTGGATASSGAHNGGVGGATSLTAGAGGAQSDGTAGAGGAGGASAVTAGAGGACSAGTGNGGAGGAASLVGAVGGNSAGGTGGAGGSVAIAAGDAGTGGNANGGDITLTPGAATGSGTPGTTTAAKGLRVTSDTAAAITTTRSLTAADSGGVFSVDKQTAYAITLPTPAQGLDFTFMTLDTGGNAVTISDGAAHLYGVVSVNNVSTAMTGTTLSLVATASVGDWVRFQGIDSTHYLVTGACIAAGDITIV